MEEDGFDHCFNGHIAAWTASALQRSELESTVAANDLALFFRGYHAAAITTANGPCECKIEV